MVLILMPQGLLEGATAETDLNDPTQVDVAEIDQDPGRQLSSDDRTEVHMEAEPESGSNGDINIEVVESDKILTGTVLDMEYEPIADAWVISEQEVEPVRTAEDGTFEIPLKGEFSADDGRGLRAWKEGMSLASKFVRQLDGNLLILKVDDGIEIEVVDRDSKLPLVGAKVAMQVDVESERGGGFFNLRRHATVPAELGETDANGKVKVPDPKVSEDYSLEITMEGYDPRTVSYWNLRRGKTVYLAQPKKTRMRFTRPDGTPHAGARLCFSWESTVVNLDKDGWADLPSSARWGFWGVQLIDEDMKWVYAQIEADQISDGATLLTHYEPRHGQVFVEGGEKASNYEIASSGSWSGWGEEFMPDPTWNGEDLDWQALEENGEFKLNQGWQAERTFLHVRRIGSKKGVLISQQVHGPGPHQLTLAAAARITLKVECPKPELLEGATLKVEGRRTDHVENKSLANGVIEYRLPVDKYRVELFLAGNAHAIPLGSCQVIGADMEQTFYFEGLRDIGGTVSAQGKGVFPCNVRVRSKDGFYVRLDTDPQGKWELKGAPQQDLTVELYPEDAWLTPVDLPRLEVPRGMNQLDHEFMVGYLLLSPGDLTEAELKRVRISRRPLPGSTLPGQRPYNRYSRPKDLDFSNGPLEIALSPCKISVSANGIPLSDTEISVRAGEFKTFVLQTVATTALSVRVRGIDLRLWGSWGVSPVHVPLMEQYPTYKVQDASGETPAGQIGNAKHVLPGRWKVWVRAPLWYWDDWGNGQIGKGRLEFEVDVRGNQQELWLQLDANQNLAPEE